MITKITGRKKIAIGKSIFTGRLLSALLGVHLAAVPQIGRL